MDSHTDSDVSSSSDRNHSPQIEDASTRIVSSAHLPTEFGIFETLIYSYKSNFHEFPLITGPPVVLISGDVRNKSGVAVRVHDQCFTSEVFSSLKCDCKKQLEFAQKYVQEHSGIIIYLHQEGRGIGLTNKIAAYSLQEKGFDTVDSNRELGFEDDYRKYDVVRDILSDLNVSSIRLMTNNPFKRTSLEKLGVIVDSLIPVVVSTTPYSEFYLSTKASRMGHILPDARKFLRSIDPKLISIGTF